MSALGARQQRPTASRATATIVKSRAGVEYTRYRIIPGRSMEYEDDEGKSLGILVDVSKAWRAVSWDRRAKRELMLEHGITTGRQWKRLKRRIRRDAGPWGDTP